VVGSVVFTCDPLLGTLRAGNWPFGIAVVLVALWGTYNMLRVRRDPP